MGPPSYWPEIAETPTRVTFQFLQGGEKCSDWFCHSSSTSQDSLLARHNRPWGIFNRVDLLTPHAAIPEQLQGMMMMDDDEAYYWSEFCLEAQNCVDTAPPLCRCCILSLFLDASLIASCYINKAKEGLQSLVDDHHAALQQRGITITYFDKSGVYTQSYGLTANIGYHTIFGFFLDVAGGNYDDDDDNDNDSLRIGLNEGDTESDGNDYDFDAGRCL
ncbi:hypothetical protein FRACYDRAFT_244119 [Fragilariopsis cylindrus CCMP1102]|uniref:Uncharacterized protein n=1 Tax=Fragilariopsis cylindrus CCMP1102 TaxID=635003 RepID=A0A1E7F3Y6_9STRA|nr:hypothetical protein FRACYDRAFT_244119 [Fragilariopsis cylindrus CCMP1102]|eukprot:OEU12846.1 hypothetical protein FRACYDRAFT_244119 [Fragilariopsis cylindrus CCMP1102]